MIISNLNTTDNTNGSIYTVCVQFECTLSLKEFVQYMQRYQIEFNIQYIIAMEYNQSND